MIGAYESFYEGMLLCIGGVWKLPIIPNAPLFSGISLMGGVSDDG